MKLASALGLYWTVLFSAVCGIANAQVAGRALLISSNYTGRSSANGSSDQFAITPDTRYVVFQSRGADLEPNDTNFISDLYLLDRLTGIRQCVTAGRQTYSPYTIETPSISADGRWIAFRSNHTNLTTGAINGRVYSLFIYDVGAGTFSVAHPAHAEPPYGPAFPLLSDDGHYLSFQNDVGGQTLRRRNLRNEENEPVTVDTNGVTVTGTLMLWRVTPDARYFAFASTARGLVPGMETPNGPAQVYWRDLQARETRLVSVAADGKPCNAPAFVRALSSDGRYVAFKTSSTNVVAGLRDNPGDDLFVRDMLSNSTWCVTLQTNGTSMAGSGQIIRDANFNRDATKLIFLSDSRDIAPNFRGGNIYAAYVHNMMTRTNQAVGNAGFQPTVVELSDDGRFALFGVGPPKIFACDLQTGRLRTVGDAPMFPSVWTIRLSGDGRSVFFVSGQDEAPTTVDANGIGSDVFVAPSMPLEILGVQLTNSSVQIESAGLPGDSVRLQSSTDFFTWEELVTGTFGPDASTIIEDPGPATPQKYYRLLAP